VSVFNALTFESLDLERKFIFGMQNVGQAVLVVTSIQVTKLPVTCYFFE